MRLVRFQKPEVWSAFDQLTNLREEINRFFDAPLINGGSDAFNVWAPALDVYEDKDNLVVHAELPGLKREEIDLSLHENTLTLSGERRNEKKYEGSQTSRSERFFGKFTRSLTLPKPVNPAGVKAEYADGILTVTLPKQDEARPRQININAN